MSFRAEGSLVIATDGEDALIDLDYFLIGAVGSHSGFENLKVSLILRLKIASIFGPLIDMYSLQANSKLLVPL